MVCHAFTFSKYPRNFEKNSITYHTFFCIDFVVANGFKKRKLFSKLLHLLPMCHIAMRMALWILPFQACKNHSLLALSTVEKRQWSELPNDWNSPTLPYI
jgi:hypothetical protein